MRDLLRINGVRLSLSGVMIGTMVVSLFAIALILYVEDRTGSCALAGMTSGAAALGAALASPLQGRLVDRRGVIVMLSMGLIQGLAILAFLFLSKATPEWLWLALGILAGVLRAPLSAALRGLWPKLISKDKLKQAYALDSICISTSYLLGPLLAAVMISISSTEVMIISAAVAALLGPALFIIGARGFELQSDADLPGAIGRATWLIALATFWLGVLFGAVEVAAVSAGEQKDLASVGALALALWTLAELLGAWVYGRQDHKRSPEHVYQLAALIVPLLLALTLLAGDPWLLALLIIPSGALIGPGFIARSEVMAKLVPRSRLTEAFGLVLGALGLGVALGASLAGALVEAHSWQAAMALAVLAGLVQALVAFSATWPVIKVSHLKKNPYS